MPGTKTSTDLVPIPRLQQMQAFGVDHVLPEGAAKVVALQHQIVGDAIRLIGVRFLVQICHAPLLCHPGSGQRISVEVSLPYYWV